MGELETFVSLLKRVAADAGLVVRVEPASSVNAAQVDGLRVLNLAYATQPKKPILQLHLSTEIKILAHRTPYFTARYRGRRVSEKWVLDFVDANSVLLPDKVETPALETGPEPKAPSPVRCYRCSGRGTSLSGDVCVYCNGTGNVVPEAPGIPHSISGTTFPQIPDNSGKLTQVEIKKMILARSAVKRGNARPDVDQEGAAAGSNIPEFPDWRDQP